MAHSPRLLRIFVGGPTDTSDERQAVVDHIANVIQKRFGDRFSFVPFTYDDDHNPVLLNATDPQGSIDEKCNVREADLVVMLFKGSLGGAKPPNGSPAPSASAWELEQAVESGKACGVLVARLPFENQRPVQLAESALGGEQEAYLRLYTAWLEKQTRKADLDSYLNNNWSEFGQKCPNLRGASVADFKAGHVVSEFISARLTELERKIADDDEKVRPLRFEGFPFCGLYEFTYENREAFFGRGAEIAEVATRCSGPDGVRLLLVHGSSGVGKSSLLQAGLMKELERAAPPGASIEHIVFEPAGETGRPFKQFATALKNLVGGRIRGSDSELAGEFRRIFDVPADGDTVMALRQAAEKFETRVASAVLDNGRGQEFVPIIFNQMEKLFDVAEDERRVFLNLIACAQHFHRIRLLCSIRQEYLGPLTRHERVNAALDANGRSVFYLPPPLRRQMADMILEPWKLAYGAPSGEFLYFVDEILDDAVKAGDAALPLLSQTLFVLHNNYKNDITRAAYARLGRLRGAVANVAEEATCDVDVKELNALFRRLTSLHDGRWLRETAKKDDLVRAGVSAALIERLASQKVRLLHIGAGANGEAVVQLAHEVLFDAWEALSNYTKDARTEESERAEVIDDARRWAHDGRRERHLKLRGEPYRRIAARLRAEPDLFAGPYREITELYVEQARKFELRGNLIAAVNAGFLGEVFDIREQGGEVEWEDRRDDSTGLRPQFWAAVTGNDRETPDPRNWATQPSPSSEAESLFVKDPKLTVSTVARGLSVGHIAALCGRLALLRRLVALRPEVATKKSEGESNLVTAAALGGDLATVRYLVEELQLPFDEEGSDGSRPILWALQKKHTSVSTYLKQRGALPHVTTREGFGTLTEAARSGDVGAVRDALDSGFGIDDCTQDGQSALFVAAQSGHVDVVRFLLSRNANPHLRTRYGSTALHSVAWQSQEAPTIVDLLIAHGADRDDCDSNDDTPLHLTASLGKLHLVRALLAQGVKRDPVNNSGYTPLMAAALNGHAAVVRELLLGGADIGISEKFGWTALHLVADDGDQTTLHELFLHASTRAVLERRTRDGFTALMLASRKAHTAVVRQLIDAGADRTAMHPAGADVLAFAIKSLSVATVREILADRPQAHPHAAPREAA